MTKLKNHSAAYWLNPSAAAAFDRMEDEQGFIDLNSAGRSVAEQQGLIDRWNRGGAANRPPYLYQPASPAESSRHVMQGGIAFDTSEYNRVRQFCERYGFRWYGNSDPVHFEYVGGGSSGGGGGGNGFDQVTQDRQRWIISRGFSVGSSGADGIFGNGTRDGYKAYQTFLRAYGYTGDIDGEWGDGTQAAHQRYYDAVNNPGNEAVRQQQAWLISRGYDLGPWGADGQKGQKTIDAIKAYQQFLRAYGYTGDIDGEWGQGTQDAHAKYYNEVQNGGNPAGPSNSGVKVDGLLGEETIKALQRLLGVDADGKIGPVTIKALQAKLGVKVDGQMGPETIKALQYNVGAKIDGQLGSETITKLQEFLNAGKSFTVAPNSTVEEPAKTYPQPSAPTYPGATWWGHSSNSSPREKKIDLFIIHHAGSTGELSGQRDRMMRPNDRDVSCTWLIGKGGEKWEIVPPDNFRPWTTGQIDHRAVTVETQNTSGAPSWGISPESHEAIAELVAWSADRYKFPIDRQHVIGHRETEAGKQTGTICPGPSMYLDLIVERAKVIYAEKYSTPTPVDPKPTPQPQPEQPKDTVVVPRATLEAMKATIENLLK